MNRLSLSWLFLPIAVLLIGAVGVAAWSVQVGWAVAATSAYTGWVVGVSLSAAVGVYVLSGYYRWPGYRQLAAQPAPWRQILSVLSVSLGFGIWELAYRQFLFLNKAVPTTLESVLDGAMHGQHVAFWSGFVLVSVVYFWLTHLLAGLFYQLNRHRPYRWVWFFWGIAIAVGVSLLAGQQPDVGWLINAGFWGLLLVGGLPRVLYTFRYRTSLYFIWTILVLAAGMAWVVFQAEKPLPTVADSSRLIAHFSFYFLLLVPFVLGIIGWYAGRATVRGFSYATRLQWWLNVAFFLPLFLVMVSMLTVIGHRYAAHQASSLRSTARDMSAALLPLLDDSQGQQVFIDEAVGRVSQQFGHALTVYNATGQVAAGNAEKGKTPTVLPDGVQRQLIEKQHRDVILTEPNGPDTYQSVYVLLKPHHGQALGVVRVPFYTSVSDLHQQIGEVLQPALSIFTGLFLLFLGLSYIVATILIKPLQLLTRKIQKTNLNQPNEPLEWPSEDEIGILIREYNRMLVKLEESKQILAQNEKKLAWREMARQVVHEIKNPLTPIKLTLQHLQRTLQTSKDGQTQEAIRRQVERPLASVIEQIDHLSDIATSFEEFEQLPQPRTEVFELTALLNRAADRYADDRRIRLHRHIEAGALWVVGDRKLIGRILTNLIINAVQSVPSGRQPQLTLRVTATGEQVMIELHDNGAGIPEAIQPKVFLPNFSTRLGGSGRGLALAKRGVEHAGGTIWFETKPDEGTSLFVTLPRANVAAPALT